jgi:starch synthase
VFYNDKDAWAGLMKRGMSFDFSWEKSANEYLSIYNKITEE